MTDIFLIAGTAFFIVGTIAGAIIGWIAFGLLTGRLKWHYGGRYW